MQSIDGTTSTPGGWPANEIIRASAGSGKTYQLCLRYLELLSRGAACPSLVAMTFTRKAAAEILERVAKVLAAAAQSPTAARQLAQDMDSPTFDAAQAGALLRRLMLQLHRLQIGTLDSFFSRLSRTSSLELGLHPHWEIGDAPTLDRLRHQAIRRVLAEDNTSDLLRLMTKGEVHRNVSDLLLETVERLYEIYLDSLPGAWDPFPAATFPLPETLASILFELEAVELEGTAAKPRDSDVARARAADWTALAGAGYFAKVAGGETTYQRRPIPPALLSPYRRLIAYVQASLRWQLRESTVATYELLRQFDQHLTGLKQQAGIYEFSDVTRWLAARELSEDAAGFARRSDMAIDHLLLDEFQDTSPAQWRILRPFAAAVAEPGTPRTFFCVGDLKQAIYGWRGGVAEVFELVESELAGLQTRDLTTSYRSSQIVIDTVNRVFENLDRYRSSDPETNAAVQAWGSRFRHHQTARDLSGYCELRCVDSGDEDSPAVLDFLVETLRPMLAAHPQLSVGILTYQNAEIPPLIRGLQQAGLAASEEGGTPLADSASVDLLISLLHLADHPDDSSSWYHLAESPLRGPLGVPEFGVGRRRSENPPAVHAFAADVRRELAEQGYGATVGRWARLAAPWCTEHELRRLQKLVELADAFDAHAGLRTSEFLAQVVATKVEEPSTAGIRVMTIHKSKGLEFDVVIVPRLRKLLAGQTEEVIVERAHPTAPISRVCRRVSADARGLLPPELSDAYRQQRNRSIRESLCVLYVALTRARRGLYLLCEPRQTASHQSPAGILLATLSTPEREPAGPVLYAQGDPQWYQAAPPANSAGPVPRGATESAFYLRAESSRLPLRLTAAAAGSRLRRGLAPSRREGFAPRNGAELFQGGRAERALTRGQLLHALLAQIEWLDGPALWDERRLEQLRPACPDQKLWRSGLAELKRILQQPVLNTWLQRQAYLQQVAARIPPASSAFDALSVALETERAFAVREESGDVVTGVFDRCVQVFAGGQLQWVDVIDFKTDSIERGDQDDLAAHVDFYRPQLAAYRRAAAQVFQLPLTRVGGTLLFTAIDLAVDVG